MFCLSSLFRFSACWEGIAPSLMIGSAFNLLLTLECVLTLVKIQGQHLGWQPGGKRYSLAFCHYWNFCPAKSRNGVVMRLSLNLENVIPWIPTPSFNAFWHGWGLIFLAWHPSFVVPAASLGGSLLPTFYELLEINLTWFSIIWQWHWPPHEPFRLIYIPAMRLTVSNAGAHYFKLLPIIIF